MAIIFADDDDFVREIAGDMLSSITEDIILCENGKEVLAQYESNKSKVKLIIMDLNMPVMDGFTAMEQLRSKGYKIPCVGFSAGTSYLINRR